MQARPSPDPKASMWAWMAHDLRFYRIQRGLTGHDVAKILNCARSSISRRENAEAKLDERQAAALDEEWMTGGHFSTMLWYARLGHDPNWFKEHLDIEAQASVIKIYESLVMPGLLQLPEYAHALIAAGGILNVDELVAERMARQAILTREPPPLLWVRRFQVVSASPAATRSSLSFSAGVLNPRV